MNKYARIENKVVVEILETSADITELFHPDLVWIECTNNPLVSEGWTYSSDVFKEPIKPIIIVEPDGAGFLQAVKTGIGGIIAANRLAVAYPLYFATIMTAEWADLEALTIDAKARVILTAEQYEEIKVLAAHYNIPINL